jgi:hypothetical protein
MTGLFSTQWSSAGEQMREMRTGKGTTGFGGSQRELILNDKMLFV